MKVKKSLFKKEYYIGNNKKDKFGPFSEAIESEKSWTNYTGSLPRFLSLYLDEPFCIYFNENEYYVKYPINKSNKTSNYTVITEDGPISIVCQDKIIAHCANLGYIVQSENDGKYGLVDSNGNYILKCEYDFIGSSSVHHDIYSNINYIIPVIHKNTIGFYNLKTNKLVTLDNVLKMCVMGSVIKTCTKTDDYHHNTYYDLNGNCIVENVYLSDPSSLVNEKVKFFESKTDLLDYTYEDIKKLKGLKNLLTFAYKHAIAKETEERKIDSLLSRYEEKVKLIDKRIAELTVPKEIVDRKREQALEKIDNTIANNNNY